MKLVTLLRAFSFPLILAVSLNAWSLCDRGASKTCNSTQCQQDPKCVKRCAKKCGITPAVAEENAVSDEEIQEFITTCKKKCQEKGDQEKIDLCTQYICTEDFARDIIEKQKNATPDLDAKNNPKKHRKAASEKNP